MAPLPLVNQTGVDGGNYWIKVKDSYLNKNTQLINVDDKQEVYLDKFKKLVR